MSDEDFQARLARIQERAQADRAAGVEQGPSQLDRANRTGGGLRKERYGEFHDTYRGANAALRIGMALGAAATGAVMAGLSAAEEAGGGPDPADLVATMLDLAAQPAGPDSAIMALAIPGLCMLGTPIILAVGHFLFRWRWAAVWLYFLGASLSVVAIGFLGPLAFLFI